MSPSDVPLHEMGPHDRPDAEFEGLLTGQPGQDPTTDLARLVAALRSDAGAPGAEDLHVAAMIEAAAHLHAEKGDPAVRPASNADAPVPQVSRLPKRRSYDMPSRRAILLKVLAPTFALLMLFSGMAFAGVLPGPLQGAVDQLVGNDDDQGIAPVLDDDQGEDLDDQGDVADDDQGEDGDHQGEDADDQGEDEGNDVSDDDQGEDGDHQGEDADDQGEDEGNNVSDDDQGEDGDHQGEDADDQGTSHDQGDDDQGDGGHTGGGDQSNDQGGDQQD